MGYFLAFGAALTFPDPPAVARWQQLAVDSTQFSDWPSILEGAADVDDVDGMTVERLLSTLADASFPSGTLRFSIEGCVVRVAGAFEEGDGMTVYAPALVAGLRRGQEVDAVGRVLLVFSDLEGAAAIDIAGSRSGCRDLDESDMKELMGSPEISAAFAVHGGDDGALSLIAAP